MKKRLLTVLLCLSLMIVSSCYPVFASESFSDISYSIDYTNKKAYISGSTYLPEIRLMVTVLNPEKRLSDIVSDETALQYQKEITTDKNGDFSVRFPLNMEAEPAESIEFEIYAKLPGSANENIITMEYKSESERNEILKKLRGTYSEILEVLNDSDDMYSLGIAQGGILDSLDKEKLSHTMHGGFDMCTYDAEGFDKAGELAGEFFVTELFNQNKGELIFDNQGRYLLSEFMDFEKHDETNKTTVYECYNTLLTGEAMTQIRSSLFGKELSNPEALHKAFAQSVVLVGLTNPALTGYAHVEKLLTDENMKLIGLETSVNIDSDKQAKIAAHSGFDSIQTLSAFIESLYGGDGEGSDDSTEGRKPVVNKGNGFGGISVQDGYFEPETKETAIFSDVPENHWAAEAIAYLKAKGVVSGVGENRFAPNDTVTREQFVKMIFAISDIKADDNASADFEDVPANSWSCTYIASAVKAGYINGISETQFGFGNFATRQDVCTVIYRMLNMPLAYEPEFTDNADISQYAFEAVGSLGAKGIINGYPDGSFNPLANCTRAEVASILYKAAKYLEVK